jgi:hypothetical protein
MSLAMKKMGKRYERHRKKLAGLAELEEEIDLFSRDRACFLAPHPKYHS